MATKNNLSGNLLHNVLINAVENNDIKTLKRSLKVNNILNIFRKPGNQTLNTCLGNAVKKCDYDMTKLLIEYGADVSAADKDGITPLRRSIYNYGITVKREAQVEENSDKEYFKDCQEECRLILGELMVNGAKPQSDGEKDKIFTILNTHKDSNKFGAIVKSSELFDPKSWRSSANSVSTSSLPKSSERQPQSVESFELQGGQSLLSSVLKSLKLSDNPKRSSVNSKGMKAPLLLIRAPETKLSSQIHDEYSTVFVPDSLSSDSALENSGYSSISEESLYAEIGDSSDRNSLEDSGCLSVSEESPYAEIDDLEKRKKPIETKQATEPIYAQVNRATKTKVKEIKKHSGTYHGLVQDKASKWQEKINSEKQNLHENRRDSGYDSSCEVDSSINHPKEQKKPPELNTTQGKFIKADAGTYLKTGSVREKINKWQDMCKQSNQERPQRRSL